MSSARRCAGKTRPVASPAARSDALRRRVLAFPVWLAATASTLVLTVAAHAGASSTTMTVNGVRDNETGTDYPDGSPPVLALNNTASGPGDRVRVNDVPGDWWEARYTDPNPGVIPDGSTLLSLVVTVQYEMEDVDWNGTLTLEAWTSTEQLGFVTGLPEHSSPTQETWDVTGLVNGEADPLATLNDLAIRMVNDDPIGNIRVRWSYTKVDVQYDQSPGLFDLLLPSDAAADVPLTPTLDWEDSGNAASYALVVSEDPGLANPVIDQSGILPSTYDVTSALDPTTTYYWQVTAVNAFGTRPCNSDFSFTTRPAELNILAFSASVSDPDVGQTISVDVSVQNSGTAPAGPFTVGLFYDRAGPPSVSDVPDMTKTVALLPPGAWVPLSFTGISGTRLGPWNMYVLADCDDDVPESNEGNNADGPVAVNWHGPDLVIPRIEPSLAAPTAGVDLIDVVVTVRNLGDREVTFLNPFNVTLFYDETAAPLVGDYPPPPKGETQTGFTLAAGAELPVTFTGIGNNVAAAWEMWAIVDNATDIDEVDETNNVGGPAAVAWQPLPDLVVSSVDTVDQGTGSPVTEPAVDDLVRVEVQVANPGLANARDFSVGLYYNLSAPPGPADLPDRSEFVVQVVPAGSQTTVDFDNVTNGSAEIWSMYVVVDCAGEIEESSDSNNALGPVTLNWGGVTDLVVLSPNGGETWESQTTRQITWAAYGSVPGTDVTIAYSTDGGGGWTDIATAPKDDGVYDWDIPDIDSAQCLVRVTSEGGSYVDPSDDVFTILPAGVAKPNLRIVSIVPSNPAPNGSDVIDVDVTVVNTGTVPAGLFFVDLFLDRSAAPSVGEPGERCESVPDLQEAGAPLNADEVTVSFIGVSSDWADHWWMYAVVDTQGYVDESNEQDNVAGPVDVSWRRFWVVWPNGGESLEPGKTYEVTWNSTLDPAELVDVEFSIDGGANWVEIASNVLNSGYDEWTVPPVESPACLVRVTDDATGAVQDGSNSFFRLQTNPKGFFGAGCAPPRTGPPHEARLGDGARALLWFLLLVGLACSRTLLSRHGRGGGISGPRDGPHRRAALRASSRSSPRSSPLLP